MIASMSLKKLGRRQWLAAVAALAMGASLPAAVAQNYPDKPIRWIVPYAAGGASDIVARLIGEGVGNELGQRVVVENRPGAGGILGTQVLASAPPDGYAMVTADNGGLYNNWYLYETMPYSPDSFEYAAMLGRFPLILAVGKDVPVRNVGEWAEWVKQNPAKASYGTPGIGSPHHLSMASLMDILGLKMTHIPYKGDSAAVVDLIGGQIPTMFMGLATARNYINDDRIRFLAVTWPDRLDALPNVPTLEQAGVKGFEISAEQGVLVPAGTPPEVVGKLNAAINKVLERPEVQDKLASLGMYPVMKSPEEFKAHVNDQRPKAGELIKRQGITIN